MAAFKDKKNGSWYVQFRYTDWRGERQQKLKRGFATKKEAQAWEREFLMQKQADVNMSLFRLPRSKLPLTFLAVPASKDRRVECPRQTFDGFIGIRGNICGFFLFVQTHAPLIVPLRQRRAGKSKFQFLSGARARMLSALHLRLVAR